MNIESIISITTLSKPTILYHHINALIMETVFRNVK